MPEPISLLAGLLSWAGQTAAAGLAGGEAHRLFRRWWETVRDPQTGLPGGDDLNRASRESLRGAVQVLILELARRVGLEASWPDRLVGHGRWTSWLARPLFGERPTPQQQWLDAFREVVAGRDFDAFHDRLRLGDAQVRAWFRHGAPLEALGAPLADQLVTWARGRITAGWEPGAFEPLVRDGWPTTQGAPARLTLIHAWGLFFREHLKSEPRVFNDFVAGALNALHTRLEERDAQTSKTLAALHATVEKLAAQPLVFSQFEAWLTPQLGALKDLLAGVQDQLDALARGQGELKQQHAEILVAITALRAEVVRGNPRAGSALDGLTAHVARLECKLDHLIGGLPITRFQLPDPPARELELLQPKHRTVTLQGRDADLAALCAWVESAEPISARLLVGGAGTGKTRLALELLLRVNAALPSWQAGFLDSDDLRRLVERTHTADFHWPAPTLLVVDYAQSLAAPLAKLLRALTRRRRDGRPPLRLLLLERQAGDWFDDLLRQDDSVGPCPVRGLFHPPKAVALTPLPPGELRREVLRQTLQKAAGLRGKRPLELPQNDPDFDAALAADQFEQPLNLMMAALAAGELGLLRALKRERIDLAETLAEKELRRIQRFARDPDNPAQQRALRHLAACATLERGFTDGELDRAAREELRALRITWPDGPGDLAERLRQALPGERLPVAPVEPDFVGEALVLLTLARADGDGDNFGRGWCATVVRCCRRDPLATPATLLHAFQNFGHQPEYGEALLAATDALIRAGGADKEPTLLLSLESALPEQTVALRERAVEITRRLYRRYKAALRAGRKDLKPVVAELANNLAGRLSEAGRREEALEPAQEAVQLYRALARAHPDAFNPDLARVLNNLAGRLSDVGRREEALEPAQEAVALYRAPARAHPDAFNPDLAMALNTLAIGLREVGRREEALEPAQEAVALYRALARVNPDAFNPDLAMSLNNLAAFLREVGRREEALVPAQEAVELRRALARAHPDAFNPDLASSLNNLATFLSEVGRREEALVPAQEAVQLYRALARALPDAFNPALASALNNLATFLSEVGRREEALGPAQEAVALRRALARANPDAFNPDLAKALGMLGMVQVVNGAPEAARASYAEALRLLAPSFRALPRAHAPLMEGLVQAYRDVSEQLGEPLDKALLVPIQKALKRLGGSGGEPPA